MCLAVPARISSINDSDEIFAYAEINGIRQKINIQLIDSPEVGDRVLIHAGFAIEKIEEDQFDFLHKLYFDSDLNNE